jgi:acyl carrier protein
MTQPEETEIAILVMDVVGARFEVACERLARSTRFVEDLDGDSLAIVELTLALEEAFDVDVASEHVQGLRTVQDAIDLVERARCPSPRAPSASRGGARPIAGAPPSMRPPNRGKPPGGRRAGVLKMGARGDPLYLRRARRRAAGG